MDHVIDLIVLTETWFAEGLSGEISGSTGHHVYRTERAGGGMSIVRSGLECTVITDFFFSILNICEECKVEIIPDINDSKQNCTLLGVCLEIPGMVLLIIQVYFIHLFTYFIINRMFSIVKSNS